MFYNQRQNGGDKTVKVNRLEVNSEQQLRNKLDSIYDNAKKGKHFYGVLELIKNEQVIMTAIHNIKSNKGSSTAGIDKLTISYFLQLPKDECIKLILDKFNNYKPLPVRRVYIGKGNLKGKKFSAKLGRKLLAEKKVRPLGIPTMIDRIIQEMIRIVIEPIFEAQFYDHSYGFRPYRGCEHALGWITRNINYSNVYIAVEGDIEGYFDNINHNKLIHIMWNMGLRDRRVLMIIKQMLKAGYMEGLKTYDTIKGSPQGGIISPLLANIYLNGFDWFMAKKYDCHPSQVNYREKKNMLAALRNKGHRPVWYTRYADDWIIMTDNLEYAEQLKAEASRYLSSKLKLTLSEKKTLITDTRISPANFLGFKIKSWKQRFGDKIVARAYPDTSKLTPKIKEIKKDIRMLRTRKSELEKQIDIEKINSKIVGIANYLRMGVSKKLMSALDYRLEHTAYKTWVHMYGKRRASALKIPVKHFTNRPDRHGEYELKHFTVQTAILTKKKDVEKIIVGLTFFKITAIKYAEVYKQEMTPYTAEGRKTYEGKLRTKARLQARPNLVSYDDIWLITATGYANPRYNFEYFLNREYVYNRDFGKCTACKKNLAPDEVKVHHKNPRLPIELVNKAKNLTCVCKRCHTLIHNDKDISTLDKSIIKKIEQYRKLVS